MLGSWERTGAELESKPPCSLILSSTVRDREGNYLGCLPKGLGARASTAVR